MKDYKILVVDDYPEHIKVITDILLHENPKYQIFAASNGLLAYEIAITRSPDLLIMDWDMPVMNGMEATLKLKENDQTKNIPIIIASGFHTDSEAMQEALFQGAIDFIRKPIDRIELVARVHSMLRFVESFQEVIRQKEIIFEQEINFKAKELTIHALFIAKQNEFQLFLIKELKKVFEVSNTQSKKLIYNLIESTNKQLKETVWENLEKHFANVFSGFYIELGSKYPSLTPNERKLCLLLRMNLSSKEIANITFQEPNSIDVARYRLRQKLGMGKEDNLTNFLNSLK